MYNASHYCLHQGQSAPPSSQYHSTITPCILQIGILTTAQVDATTSSRQGADVLNEDFSCRKGLALHGCCFWKTTDTVFRTTVLVKVYLGKRLSKDMVLLVWWSFRQQNENSTHYSCTSWFLQSHSRGWKYKVGLGKTTLDFQCDC